DPSKKRFAPAVELEHAQALDSDVRAATVLGPSLYVPLSRRGHVALGMGAQLPVAGARPFDWRVWGVGLRGGQGRSAMGLVSRASRRDGRERGRDRGAAALRRSHPARASATFAELLIAEAAGRSDGKGARGREQ